MWIARIFSAIFLCLCVVGISPAEVYKRILMLPYPFPSHVSAQTHIGDALAQKGHQVYMGISERYPFLGKLRESLKDITIITHKNEKPDLFELYDASQMDQFLEIGLEAIMAAEMGTNANGSLEICTNMLSDKDFHHTLKLINFDLVIVDSFAFSRCFCIVPYILDVPWISAYTLYEPWLSRNPSLPSVTPFVIGRPYTEKMNFWERLDNLRWMLKFTVNNGAYELSDNLVSTYAKEKPAVTLNYLAGKSLLWLVDIDILIDYPRPTMPNEIFIGGLTTQPSKPLPDDLQKFVSSAPDGVILVSFGSSTANLPQRIQKAMFGAFQRLKQRVLWRFPHSIPTDVPKNVRLLEWLPQNDILGDKNTVLLITHCGANGQFEALYHGVPMIGLPMFGDQPYNARRMQYHGYGIKLSLKNLTEYELYETIQEVIHNPMYKKNIQKASQIYRSRPMTPTQTAVYWIEHVLKYGGQHLRSYALDMPWYQYLMLDILAFIIFLIILINAIFFCIIKRLCYRKGHKKEKIS